MFNFLKQHFSKIQIKKKNLKQIPSSVAPPSGQFKGYNSNQSEFRIVITFKAAKPMAV